MTLQHGVTTSDMDDTNLFRLVEVMAQNKRFQAAMFSMYGIAFNPPPGSYAAVFCGDGKPENRTAILDYLEGRFKDIQPGEIRVGNYLTQSSIYFKEDASVVVEATGAPIYLKGSQVYIQAPDIALQGAVTVQGSLEVSGLSTLNGIEFDTHGHGGVQPGGSVSGGPQN